MKTTLNTGLMLLLIANVCLAQDAGSGIKIRERGDDYDHKWALVVGINYDDATNVPHLNNAESDAAAFGKLLKDSYGFDCEVLVGKNATAAETKLRLKKYEKSVGEKDCFLFYFAGHGIPRDDLPLLYPADVEVAGEVANTLSATEIIRSEIKSLHSLYIFDSCFSGQIANLNRFPPLNQMRIRQGQSKFESRSIQILTSSSNNQTAKDGTNGRSPFSLAIEDGFRRQRELDSADRISASALHEHVAKSLEAGGQECQLLSLVPEADSAFGGEFYFNGKAPAPAPSRSLVFQTLPGTYATLPGSPLPRTWFDETPWLTPAMRLLADGEFEAIVRPYVGGTVEQAERLRDPRELANRLLHDTNWTPEVSVHDVALRLEGLGSVGESDYLRAVNELQSSIKTRSSHASTTDLHLAALLEVARLKHAKSLPDDVQLENLHVQFKNAADAYGVDQNIGLQARCLADHAHWLMEVCPEKFKDESKEETRYKLAIEYFERGLDIVKNIHGTEMFRVELHAGAGYAWRQRAKKIIAESTPSEATSRANRREALNSWRRASEHYEYAMNAAKEAHLELNDPIVSYLNQRIGWLSMDLWDVKSAMERFADSAKFDSSQPSDIVAFLSHTSSLQGLAMSKRLSGACAKEDLASIQKQILTRIEKTPEGSAEWLLLQVRLCNATERLAECDFLKGRTGLIDASSTFKRGIQYCNRWRDSVSIQSEEDVDEQELRFVCKLFIASTLLGEDLTRRDLIARYDQLKDTKASASGVSKVLCDLTDAFAIYGQLKSDNKSSTEIQNGLNEIRNVVHRNSNAALDREPAELLLAISNALALEQQKLDAKIQLSLLPRTPNGELPKEMPKSVRQQYDDVILMQGRTFYGRIPSTDFDDFRELVRAVRQSELSKEDMIDPFVVFFLPINGANGLLILSYGDNDSQRRGGEVYELGFGWKNIPKVLDSRIESVLRKFDNEYQSVKIGWSDDLHLVAEGFAVNCPYDFQNSTTR